jgi:iron complex transport system substrate-binding protein
VRGAAVRPGSRQVARALAPLLALLSTSAAGARELTDMVGRRVTVPDRIERVISLSPPTTQLVYALDVSLLQGINFPLWESEKRLTAEAYRRLPVVGGRVGEGRQINLEVLLAAKPDLVILWTRDGRQDAIDQEYEATLGRLGLPVVYVRAGPIRDYPKALRFLGRVLDRGPRAEELARHGERLLAATDQTLAGLPEQARPTVYYAEGADGLATDGEGSMHTELIPIAGGRNVRGTPPRTMMGMEVISFEQVALYDPDFILVKDRATFERLRSEPRWQHLRAMQAGRMVLIPGLPFNWFDRPPSFMRFLGAAWLTQLLHPDRARWDLPEETRRFYRLFLGVELSDAQVKEVLER